MNSSSVIVGSSSLSGSSSFSVVSHLSREYSFHLDGVPVPVGSYTNLEFDSYSASGWPGVYLTKSFCQKGSPVDAAHHCTGPTGGTSGEENQKRHLSAERQSQWCQHHFLATSATTSATTENGLVFAAVPASESRCQIIEMGVPGSAI